MPNGVFFFFTKSSRPLPEKLEKSCSYDGDFTVPQLSLQMAFPGIHARVRRTKIKHSFPFPFRRLREMNAYLRRTGRSSDKPPPPPPPTTPHPPPLFLCNRGVPFLDSLSSRSSDGQRTERRDVQQLMQRGADRALLPSKRRI